MDHVFETVRKDTPIISSHGNAMDIAGFTDDEIEKVFYKNILRVFGDVFGK